MLALEIPPVDVVKAMEVAFQYRQYFRKVMLLDVLNFCHSMLGRISSLTSWFTADGKFYLLIQLLRKVD